MIAAAAVTAPVLLALWTPGAMRATLRSYVWLYVIFAGGVLLGAGAQAARGRQLVRDQFSTSSWADLARDLWCGKEAGAEPAEVG